MNERQARYPAAWCDALKLGDTLSVVMTVLPHGATQSALGWGSKILNCAGQRLILDFF